MENYEQKYKDALEKAKCLIQNEETNIPVFYVDNIKDLFSELKESEGEKIRKHLISLFENFVTLGVANECETADIKVDNILAWLEKQGEHNKWKPSKDEMNALYGLSYITNKMDDKKDESITKLYQDLKREFFNGASYENMFPSSPVDSDINIEKQGKQQDVNIQINPSEYINDMGGNGCYLKNTVQKPADKVEPKFKVGDWVIDKSFGSIKQIKHFDNDEKVWFTDGTGTFIEFLEGYRLWTIKDAKPGDVLHATGWHSDCIFIFSGLDNWKFDEPDGEKALATSYCCIHVYSDMIEFGTQGPDCIEVNTVKPATKIQCDLLFRNIRENGYEWDANALELKKMSLNKEDIKPFTIEHGKYYYCIEDYWSGGNKRASKGDVVQALRGMNMMALNSEEAANYFLPVNSIKQKSNEWDEEDEKMFRSLHNIIYVVRDCDCDSKEKKELSDWLKSLRPQSQWKPSKEQIIALRWVLNNIPYNIHKEEISGLLDQIKEL